MNRINPEKLLRSKWTALSPSRRQRHFIVTDLFRDEQDRIAACEIEAVINREASLINWRDLKDDSRWVMGWK